MPTRKRSRKLPIPAGQLSASSLVDRIEDLQGQFSEITEHVLHLPEFRSITAGPVEPLSLEALSPGALGWLREFSLRSPGAKPSPHATAYMFLLPRHIVMGGALPAEPPLRGRLWTDFCLVDRAKDSPETLLTIRTAAGVDAARVRPLAEALRAEFRSERSS